MPAGTYELGDIKPAINGDDGVRVTKSPDGAVDSGNPDTVS